MGAGAIWVTRAQPGAEATARRIAALGRTAVVDPLLEVRSLDTHIDLTGVTALAFTSVNGVAAFARLSPARDLAVFTVGAATAQAARAAGFADPASADGDVAALAGLLIQARPRLVLQAGALTPAADLPALLAAEGVAARAVAVYETLDRPPSSRTLADLDEMDAVLVHSPRAARCLATLLAANSAPGLRALCLSTAVAAPLAGPAAEGRVGAVCVAAQPHESALLALLQG